MKTDSDVKDLQKDWQEAVCRNVQSFIVEMGNRGRCLKLTTIYFDLIELDRQIARMEKMRVELPMNQETEEFIDSCINEMEKERRSLEMKARWTVARRKGVISDEMIQMARSFPIRELLKFRGNKTHCIAHDDRHPSMGLIDNRVHCFACGFTGNAIDVYMKINNCDFTTAVRALAGG